ncbi:periplasmic flagellar collar protein FlcA [Thermospira aquatica]|uniref:Tetratricopeptide repeat protein n=1 Tax=Thermospira aquatica TaxID=2828656 RepID=A0AAX3BDH4_9SPIR|nr:tetratricopeptide repeat protein [Thermospira aquatica]URA10173.1 hypothetical protein KDW03_11950 [Thermospira aquatica]
MGRFDSIEKFLGKEENFSSQQIEAGLDSMDNIPTQLSEVNPDALANVERLIQGSDVPPSSGEKGEAFSLENAVSGQSASLPEELLKELQVLDGPPPSLDELDARFSSLREIMSSLSEEEKETPGGEELPFEMEFSEEKVSQPLSEDVTLSVPSGEVDSDLADLLGQMTVEKEQPESEMTGMEGLLSSLGISDSQASEFSVPSMEKAESPFEPSLEPSFEKEISSEEVPIEMPFADKTGGGEEAFEEMPSLEGFGEIGETGPAPEPYTFPSFDEISTQPSMEEPSLVGPGEGQELSFEIPFEEETPGAAQETGAFGGADTIGFETEFPEISEGEPSSKPPSFDFDLGISEPEPSLPPSGTVGEFSSQEMLLDPEKAVKIRDRINKIKKTDVRQRIREAIVKGGLSEELLKELLLKLLLNESDANLEAFDRRYLQGVTVEPRVTPSFGQPTRRVIYTEEAIKAEQLNKQLGKVGGLSLLLLLISVALSALMWVGVIQPVLAGREYEKGLKAIEQKDYVFAEKKFQRGKEIGGFSVKWHNIYAQKYTEVKQWELARQKYEAVLQRKPLDRKTIINYAEFNKQLYPPRYDEAVSLYTRLYKRFPKDFAIVDALGQTYVEWADRTQDTFDRLERFKKANDLYGTYLMKKSKDVGAHFRLLDIAIRVTNETLIDGRYQIIEKLNKKAVNFPILTRLAGYYIDKRRLSDAGKVLQKLIPLIKIKIRESDGMYVLDESMNKFSNQKPVYDETLYQFGRLQTLRLDFVRALWALSNAVGLNPSNAKAYNLMGEIYYTTDERPEAKRLAISLFETAQRLTPSYYKPYVNLGHLYYYNDLGFKDEESALFKALGYYKVAYQLYQMGQVDKLSPDPKLFYNLSWLYYKYGNYEEALRVLSQIYVTDPLNPYYSYAIGNMYQKMGIGDLAEVNYMKAIDYFNDIVKRIKYINPDSTRHREVFTQLARAYNNLGVVYFSAARYNPKMAQEYEAKALLYFYNAKNMANKINLLYPEAEYNIKVVLNKGIRGRVAKLDETLVKQTSLHRILEELKNSMIDEL